MTSRTIMTAAVFCASHAVPGVSAAGAAYPDRCRPAAPGNAPARPGLDCRSPAAQFAGLFRRNPARWFEEPVAWRRGSGARNLDHLDFVQFGGDVIISFASTEITIEDTLIAFMQSPNHFLFT